MLTRQPYFIIAVLLSCVCLHAEASEPAKGTPRICRIALLDYQAPAECAWLGTALREGLAAKLIGLPDVALIERKKINTLLQAHKGSTVEPTLLGADILLTGSVQRLPSSDSSKLRISTRLLAADSLRLIGQAAFIVDGNEADLFQLENDIAERCCRAIGHKAAFDVIGYQEARNLTATRLYAEALQLSASSHDPVQLQRAIDRLQQAQKSNEGRFFAQAHGLEADLREALAARQKSETARQDMRKQTIDKFLQDAADAAPAFFDLGRAQEARGHLQESLASYESYLKWMDENFRVERWHKKTNMFSLVQRPAYPGTNVGHVLTDELFSQTGKYLVLGGGYRFAVYDQQSQKKCWQKTLVPYSKVKVLPEVAADQFIRANARIIINLSGQTMTIFQTNNGKKILQLQLPLPVMEPLKYQGKSQRGFSMVYLFPTPEKPVRAVIARHLTTRFSNPKRYELKAALVAVDLKLQRVLWEKHWTHQPERFCRAAYLPQGWKERLLCYWPFADAASSPAMFRESKTGEPVPLGSQFALRQLLIASDMRYDICPAADRPGTYWIPWLDASKQGIWKRDWPAAYFMPADSEELQPLEYGAVLRRTDYAHMANGSGANRRLVQHSTFKPGDPWLGYDAEQAGWVCRKDRLPCSVGKRSNALGGWLAGNRLWMRWKDRVSLFALRNEKPAQLRWEFISATRLRSHPLPSADTVLLYQASTAVSRDTSIVKVGPSPNGKAISDATTLIRMAGVHQQLGDLERSVNCLLQAHRKRICDASVYQNLIEQLEALDRRGEASGYCEIAAGLLRKNDATRSTLEATHSRLLGRVTSARKIKAFLPTDQSWVATAEKCYNQWINQKVKRAQPTTNSITSPFTATSFFNAYRRIRHSHLLIGTLGPKGPWLARSYRSISLALFDPYSGSEICSSPIGLTQRERETSGTSRHTRLGHALIGSSSQAFGRNLFFDRKQFLQILGWTSIRQQQYAAAVQKQPSIFRLPTEEKDS